MTPTTPIPAPPSPRRPSRPLMAPALALLLSLGGTSAYPQAPAPQPAPAPAARPAKAVAISRPSYPSGSVVFVDARGSITGKDWPLQIQVVDRPNEPKSTLDGGMGAIFPALPDGSYFIAVTASAPVEGKPPAVDTAVVSVMVGPAPTPIPVAPVDPVTPVVPTPVPVDPTPPLTPMQAIGRSFAAADVNSLADTWAESATMLAAGTPAATITGSFSARWQARRVAAFADAGNAFAKIAPAGTEPTGAARDGLAAAWRDFAAGLKLGVSK